MQRNGIDHGWPFAALLGTMATLMICLFGFLANFHVGLNDFWGLLFYARNMSVAAPESLHNGFFPVGYAVLLKCFPQGSEIHLAYALNAIFTGVLASATVLLLTPSHGRMAALAGFAIVVSNPILFQYANTIGPDLGTAALTGLAVWLLWKNELRETGQGPSLRDLVLAGVFLGCSALFRTHCLVSSLAVILAFLLTRKTIQLKSHGALAAVFCGVMLLQVCVNLVSGHGALETAQKFNVYKLIHDVNWWRPPAAIDGTMLDLFLSSPGQLIKSYVLSLADLVEFGWPALLGCAVCRREASLRFCLFSALAVAMYAVPTALGGSPRSPIPIAVFYVVPVSMLAAEGVRRIASGGSVAGFQKVALVLVLGMTAGLGLMGWLHADYSLLKAFRKTSGSFSEIESRLKQRGMTSGREVFMDSFDLYFRSSAGYRPRHNGGWVVFALWGYNEANPQLPVDSRDAFLSACKEHGVRFLVLSPESTNLSDFLDDLYANGPKGGDEAFKPIGEVAPFRIFELADRPDRVPGSD